MFRKIDRKRDGFILEGGVGPRNFDSEDEVGSKFDILDDESVSSDKKDLLEKNKISTEMLGTGVENIKSNYINAVDYALSIWPDRVKNWPSPKENQVFTNDYLSGRIQYLKDSEYRKVEFTDVPNDQKELVDYSLQTVLCLSDNFLSKNDDAFNGIERKVELEIFTEKMKQAVIDFQMSAEKFYSDNDGSFFWEDIRLNSEFSRCKDVAYITRLFNKNIENIQSFIEKNESGIWHPLKENDEIFIEKLRNPVIMK